MLQRLQLLATLLGALVLSVAPFVGVFSGCSASSANAAAVTAADVVNTVAHKGDQLYGVSVDSCHAAEKLAVELPNVADAEKLVAKIRSRCDVAFHAIEAVRTAIAAVDDAAAKAQAGAITAKDLVAVALSARDLFEHTQAQLTELAAYLEHPS